MLRIHTGLQKWNNRDRYHILLRDNNPMRIDWPFIKIANNEVLFAKYRMDLKRDKDSIEVQGDDAIKRNGLCFDFIIRMFNHLNQLYENKKGLLIYTILKYQSRKDSAKENTSKTSLKLLFCG